MLPRVGRGVGCPVSSIGRVGRGGVTAGPEAGPLSLTRAGLGLREPLRRHGDVAHIYRLWAESLQRGRVQASGAGRVEAGHS